jgi:hypothetical protein
MPRNVETKTHYTVEELHVEVALNPVLKLCPPLAHRKKVNAVPKLGVGDERDVEVAVIGALHPGVNTRVRGQFRVLRYHIRIK